MTDYLRMAFEAGHLRLEGSGRSERMLYVAAPRTERWSDPEEKVRAAYYAELIYRYGYKPNRIGVEVTIPDRSPNDFADLVVFFDDDRKRPFAVIECKKEGVSDVQFTQAVEQAWGNGNAHKFRAKYVGVVAGATRRFLDCDDAKFGALERDRNQVADLPIDYSAPPSFKYRKGGGLASLDIAPVGKGELMEAIRKCHQTLWGGGRLSPPAAFGEFCKLIFVKVRDEKVPRKQGVPYEFQIKTDETTADLGARIRDRYAVEMVRDPDVFSEPIKADDGTLRMCVEHLEGINFSATDLDTKGVAFEQFLDGFFKGDFGQYFTPREVIQFCVAMLPPAVGDMVLDTSCGSGGFLLYAMDHVRHEANEVFGPEEAVARFQYWHDFAQHRLFGVEINDEISRVAKMNMILHDDGHTNVVAVDGLADFPVLAQRNPKLRRGAFDLVLTNPPFGAVVKATEKGQAYLDRFELTRFIGKGGDTAAGGATGYKAGKAAVKARASVKTEILFLERIHDFLKPSTGRAAVVVPDGILTNGSLQGVRDWLLSRFQVLAVVSLPQEAFQHSGASVKASLLFLRRRATGEAASDDEPIFMAAPANIGFDATGRQILRRTVVRESEADKVEHVASDLFTAEVSYVRPSGTPGAGWEERGRRILLDQGVLGAYRRFEARPASFLA